ncbi:MAG: gamma-glutamyltransferase [Pseudomonadota bacterium]|jgi:gamma-glutamyltranspeptidase/glutathione hydrolase
MRRARIWFAGVTTLCLALAAAADAPQQPEGASGYTSKEAVSARRFMVASANPLATDAGYEILGRGGSAIDAAIAVQMVLNLVEPQSSGIGGGAFLVHYSGRERRLTTYDGRETAPAAARPERFLGADGKPVKFYDAVVGGKSVGVPGLLRALDLAHRRHGRLPWAELFQPAIRLAQEGFAVSPRLATLLAKEKYLQRQKAARRYFHNPDGSPLQAGQRLRNPEFAATLRAIAQGGADAFYRGDIARDIVASVAGAPDNPGDLTLEDLAAYRAVEREPVCGGYRGYKVCGMGPPSSGAVTVLQILGILERFSLKSAPPVSLMAVHLFSEAGKLAYADRGLYLADPDFVDVPVRGLLARDYLAQRAALIRYGAAMTKAQPGMPAMKETAWLGQDEPLELPATSHISVVDAYGNALAMTTTIEDAFGSRLMVRGFLLNNELTDFSFAPEEDGRPVANRIEARKRPRSSMAPTIVFDAKGRLCAVLGSPGGSQIINYVAQALVGLIDWQLDPAQAAALPHYGSRNGPTELEQGTAAAALADSLKLLGHDVRIMEMTSGTHIIRRQGDKWRGAADPRREGTARGE